MSSIDWAPELAAALDRLVPLEAGSRADWEDVVGRIGRHGKLRLVRVPRSRRLRLVLVVVLVFLLLTGVATATYLLVRGNGDIALGGGAGTLLVVDPNEPGVHAIARCPVVTPGCAFFNPTWSPDGARVAFLRGYGGPVQRSEISLYVAAADGSGAERLAACGECGAVGGDGGIAWSPNSRWIAFTRNAGFTWPSSSLWVVGAAGGKPRRLTHCRTRCADLDPQWSPNGHLILFARATGTSNGSGIYTIRPDGSGLKEILAGGTGFRWSPDGHRIAFDNTPDSIAVANADGSHLRVLFAGARGTGPGYPSWSPDGRKLVFFKTPRGGRRGYRTEVWTMNPDGSGKKRLYHSGCCVDAWAPPIWSPDGRLIAFSADSAGGTFVISADGTGLRRLSPLTFGELSWQAPPRKGGTK